MIVNISASAISSGKLVARIYVAICLLLHIGASHELNAQVLNLDWAHTMNTSGNMKFAVSETGHSYHMGSYSASNTDFDPGPGVFTLSGATPRYYLQKLDSAQNLKWAKLIFTGNSVSGSSTVFPELIEVDKHENIYVAGEFEGTVDFDPGSGVDNKSSLDLNEGSGFVTKYDSAGTYMWTKVFGGDGGISVPYFVVDTFSNLHLFGSFINGTIDFDPDPNSSVSINTTWPTFSVGNGYILKLDQDGDFQWVQRIQTSYPFGPRGLDVDEDGNVYTTGEFRGTVDFDPGSGIFNLITPSANNSDAYVQKLDSNGNLVWAKQFERIEPAGVIVDQDGDVTVHGKFSGNYDFDPGPGTYNMVSWGAGNSNYFHVQLSSLGDFNWARQIESSGSGGFTLAHADVDSRGNIITLGRYSQFIDLNTEDGLDTSSVFGSLDLYLHVLSEDGVYIGGYTFGSAGNEFADGVNIGPGDRIYGAGEVSGSSVDVDPTDSVFAVTNYGINRAPLRLKLSGNYPGIRVDKVTACDAYTWNGVTYTSSTFSPRDTLTTLSSGGTDSIAVLQLTILHSSEDTIAVTACDSFLWNVNNMVYTANGFYVDTILNVAGCDSIITLDLTLNSSSASTDTVTACNSYTWIDGNTYTASNTTATDTFMNAMGCDSIVTLNLTINYSDTTAETITACDSFAWSTNGMTYNTSGIYMDTLTNSLGCDSIVSLNLTINYSNTGSETATACDSYTWPTSGLTYTTSGTYLDTLTNIDGCDSVITLNLTVNYGDSAAQNITACDSFFWSTTNMTYFSSGTYDTLLSTVLGCDSLATIHLTIHSSTAGSENITACDSYAWSANNMTYMASGPYTATLTNAVGCDSIATLNLTIHQSTSGSETIIACDAYNWPTSGITYLQSGTYTDTLVNAVGCDSIAILNLTINETATSTEVVDACDNYTWGVNGVLYNTSGLYVDTLATSQGCDSIVFLDLTVHSSFLDEDTVSACNSYTWPVNDSLILTSGSYVATYPTISGCDSIYELELTINSVSDITTLVSATTIMANNESASYQWLDCNTGIAFTNETEQEFTPSSNGDYAVELTENGCVDTSECVSINNVGIGELNTDPLLIYPNPNSGQFTVDMGTSKVQVLRVFNSQGQLVQEKRVQSNHEVIQTTRVTGVYFLEAWNDQKVISRTRFIVQ